ncbi:MAG: hypothetical protein ACK553_15400 [Planctomycetota bacterium]|jgi:hypothetical protein
MPQTILFDRWLRIALWALMIGVFFDSSRSALAQVVFDINSVVPARSADTVGMMARMPESRFVEVQLETSALFQPAWSDAIQEITISAVSRHDDVRVADYFPRTELQTDVFGPMQVAVDAERVREGGLQGLGGYPGVGSASAFAYQMESGQQSVHFAQKPALELVTASGTLQRQQGVYFKQRRSTQGTLEGSRLFRIVFEVPETWRADLLDVTMEAIGYENPKSRRSVVLSSQRYVVAVYQEGDEVAARVAANYRKQHNHLTMTVDAHAWEIQHRAFPTPFHKLGAKLDIYEPELPSGWLQSIMHQPGAPYPMYKLSILPVDVRVAIMNYLDQKTRIESLSGSRDAGGFHGAERVADQVEVARR